MWLHSRSTWSTREKPVKIVLNKFRGRGITVYGALGSSMRRPVFMQADSTNKIDVAKFMGLIRREYRHMPHTQINIVLDNALAHNTILVRQACVRLSINLVFQPPYSPEFNCCEPMWAVLKTRFKQKLAEQKLVFLGQERFAQLL